MRWFFFSFEEYPLKFCSVDRTRIHPEPSIGECKLTRHPLKVPIDYFDPAYFNSMSVKDRAAYVDNGVALPVPEICVDGAKIKEWKNLPYDKFMEKFGNDTLALYNLPTEAEMEQLDEYEDDDDDQDDDDQDDEGDT